MNTLSRIRAIIFKELRHIARDRTTLAMMLMIPFIQLLLFGYAINTNIRHIPVGYVDNAHNQTARLLKQAVHATQVVDFTHQYNSPENARLAIQSGDVKAVFVIPKDINQRLEQNRPIAQWMVDGSDSVLGAALLGLKNMPFSLNEKQVNIPIKRVKNTSTFAVTLFYNPSQRSAVNIIPGLIGVILTMTMVLFTSISIVREREKGNLELLIMTPVKPLELMIAKIIPYIFVGLIQVMIILGLGYLIFNVPINGSVLQIFLGALLFIMASLTLGLLISTHAKSQLQAMQMTLFIMLPSILLSGFMFPYEGMPIIAQWISEALPATHFMRLIRGVVLRGADLSELWRDSLWLAGFTIIGILISAKRFKKSLD